jgi:hypothetical protein
MTVRRFGMTIRGAEMTVEGRKNSNWKVHEDRKDFLYAIA